MTDATHGNMNLSSWPWRLGGLLASVVLLLIPFLVARPWYLSWGATDQEKTMVLPGDQIVPVAASQETRAISIAAPAEHVWAWVSQIGQDRGGFYSYEILEDLAGCQMPSVKRLDPALQLWEIGDKLWMYPPEKFAGAGHVLLTVLEPGRALGFASRQIGTPVTAPYDGSWSFVVHPVDERNSRLLFRGRAAGGAGPFATAFTVLGFEPVHFAMERRTLEAIKEFAEGGRPSRVENNLQVLAWTLTFLAFAGSAFLLVSGGSPGPRLATFIAAGFLFMFLTLVQPTPWLGLSLAVVLGFATIAPWRRSPRVSTTPERGAAVNNGTRGRRRLGLPSETPKSKFIERS